MGHLRQKAPLGDRLTRLIDVAHLDFPFADVRETNREGTVDGLSCVVDRGEV